MARKGSICIDGVSLTVNGADGDRFDVNLVPHTLEVTTLGALPAGQPRINLEVDIIARYVERMMRPAELQPTRGRGRPCAADCTLLDCAPRAASTVRFTSRYNTM